MTKSTVKPLSILALQTPLFRAGDSLKDFVISNVSGELVHEKMIIAITSKIVSLSENRIVKKDAIAKAELIDLEAEHTLCAIAYGSILTIKNGLLLISAGIDESNSEFGDYILYPENPFASAQKIWSELRSHWQLANLGVILTDSKSSPLRLGVTGVSIAHAGFHGLKDHVGRRDLFDRKLKMTKSNFSDGLACAATLMMGEAAESRPLAIVTGADVAFIDTLSAFDASSELNVRVEDDLYFPFLRPFLK